MNADQTASLIYLVLLAVAVTGWFIARNRDSLGKVMQMAVLWGLLFLGVIAAKGLWDDIRRASLTSSQTVSRDGAIVLNRAGDGHFYASLDLNEVPVRFLIDTGASQVVLTLKDAQRIGIDTDRLAFLGRAETANGTVRTAYARIDSVVFGAYSDRNVGVSINQAEMDISLLGMSYLGRFGTVQISGDQMILIR